MRRAGMRRSWPQRLTLLSGVVVAGGCFFAATAIGEVDDARRSIPHLQFLVGIENGLVEVVDSGQPQNILLVGVDESIGLDRDNPILIDREGTKATDAIIVVRLDPRTKRAYMLSIPRDLLVDYASGGSGRINTAYALGGVQELQRTISQELGIPINRVITVNLAGFAAVVDELGGIEIYFPYETRSIRTHFHVEAGCQNLLGFDALAYVRARTDFQERIEGSWSTTGVNDYDRMERQQDFLTLALRQVFDRFGRDSRDLFDLIDVVVDSEALVLDNVTGLQDLKNLAGPFTDFSPDSLQRWALTDAYVRGVNFGGAAVLELDEEAAAPILRVFQGYEPGSLIALTVSSDDTQLVEQLEVKDVFEITSGGSSTSGPTTITASLDQLEQAREVASWLADLPTIEIVAGQGVLELRFGDDDPKVLAFAPRSEEEWEAEFNEAVADASAEAGDIVEVLPTTSADGDAVDEDDDGVVASSTTAAPDVAPAESRPTTSSLELLPGECPPD